MSLSPGSPPWHEPQDPWARWSPRKLVKDLSQEMAAWSFSMTHSCIAVFVNGPGDLSSIPGRVIPKTQKMVLDASLLNTQHYKVRIKGKVEQSRERVAPSPTPWCSSYRKGSLRVTLDYGRQLYLLYHWSVLLSFGKISNQPLIRMSGCEFICMADSTGTFKKKRKKIQTVFLSICILLLPGEIHCNFRGW